MEINRKKLEELTTSLAVTLLGALVITITLVAANYAFAWNLFPPALEKAGVVIIISSFLVVFASVIINIMLNIGRIADASESKKSTHGEVKINH